MGWRDFLRLSAASPRVRATGPPPSGNTASSMHLFWQLPAHPPLLEVSVDFELLDTPRTDRLYFWALQVGFADHTGGHGAGHFGFQWNRDYPARRAVCWGGYANVGGELSGGPMPLSPDAAPSPDGNPNVCGFAWTIGERWRWRIRALPPDGAAGITAAARTGTTGSHLWRAEIENPRTGRVTAIRDLWCPGDHLIDPMVWSEVFAHCDDPPVAVRWSRFIATDFDDQRYQPTALAVNYQSYEHGGCTNTDITPTEAGVIQTTNCERTTTQGSVVSLSPSPPSPT